MSATDFGWLILAFPLAGAITIGLTWKVLSGKAAGWIGTFSIGAAFICSIGALLELLSHPVEERQLTDTLYNYASAAGVPFDLSILIDPLSVFMALVVTGVSTLIHLYSVAYMGGTPAIGASSPTSTSSSSRCCCWSWPATTSC